MKKLTFFLTLLAAFSFSSRVVAAESSDTISYDLSSDGVWSNIDNVSGFYSTWTSSDGMLKITSDALNSSGMHIGFQTQSVSGYPMIRCYPGVTQPSTIMMVPAKGYKIAKYNFSAISNWNKSYTHTVDRGDTIFSVTTADWTTLEDSVARDTVKFKLTSSNNDVWSDMMLYYATGAAMVYLVKEPITYDLTTDGTWSNPDNLSGLFSTWTSKDSLLTITSDAVNTSGQHIGFGIYNSTYLRCFPGSNQPATITMKAADGYEIVNYYLYAESNNFHSWTTSLTRDDNKVFSMTNAAWVEVSDSVAHNSVSFKLASSDNDLWSDMWIYYASGYQYITIQRASSTPTGIQTIPTTNVEKSTKNNAIYDLEGRRVLVPRKGIYIVNGKKILYK
jgi:hypothetical protein